MIKSHYSYMLYLWPTLTVYKVHRGLAGLRLIRWRKLWKSIYFADNSTSIWHGSQLRAVRTVRTLLDGQQAAWAACSWWPRRLVWSRSHLRATTREINFVSQLCVPSERTYLQGCDCLYVWVTSDFSQLARRVTSSLIPCLDTRLTFAVTKICCPT